MLAHSLIVPRGELVKGLVVCCQRELTTSCARKVAWRWWSPPPAPAQKSWALAEVAALA